LLLCWLNDGEYGNGDRVNGVIFDRECGFKNEYAETLHIDRDASTQTLKTTT